MSTPSRACPQCGAPADTNRIFCAKCGATLQHPASLLPSGPGNTDIPPKASSTLRDVLAFVIKGVALIAGIVFWVAPITRGTGILWFGASIVALLLCFGFLSYLDHNFAKGNEKEGYWPKPLDWGTPMNIESNEKNNSSSTDPPS